MGAPAYLHQLPVMSVPITRRAFLDRAALAALAVAAPRVRWRTAAAPLRIAVIPSANAPDRALGIQLGVDEARHAAALFGGGVELQTAAPREPFATAAARLAGATPTVMIGGDTASECERLAAIAAAHGAIYFNVGCADDALRARACSRAAFHVCPSGAMLRQATTERPAAAGATALAWDPALVKFGADTLNERFLKQFNRPMNSASWCGWVAIKIAWEASLRARSTEGQAIGAFLETPAAQFDGHKGRPLSFRTWNHQLRQPVYVTAAPVAAGSAVAGAGQPIEVPSSREEEDARTSLDRLGISQSASACTWTA